MIVVLAFALLVALATNALLGTLEALSSQGRALRSPGARIKPRLG
jgi:hypothetical protein